MTTTPTMAENSATQPLKVSKTTQSPPFIVLIEKYKYSNI